MREEIFKQVQSVVVDRLGVKPEEVTEQASFMEDLNADSLDVVELIMALEDKFGIDIPDEEVQQLRTVSDVINYVETKAPTT